jgi:hypothetical protein
MDQLLVQQPAAPPRGPSKPSLKLPVKRLDEDLLTILRRHKADAGMLPGVPFH